MPVFFGTTSSSAIGDAINIPYKVKSFSVANKTGGSITVSVGVVYGSTIVYWLYNEPLNSGENYVWLGDEILIESGYAIFVSASASCDYYFSTE